MKTSFFCILFGTILLLFSFENSSAQKNGINGPVYPSAQNIKSFVDKDHGVYSKSYILISDYTINDLFSFYSAELNNIDFIEVENDSSKKGWMNFIDMINGVQFHICQFSKEWVSIDKSKKAILLLQHKSRDVDRLRDKLFVTIQFMPNINEALIHDFFKELEKDGEFVDFMKLLEKYKTPDGNINFTKAISENPNNKDLRHYKEILYDANLLINGGNH